MRRVTFVRLFAVVFVLQGAWAYTQAQRPARPLRAEPIRGDLHLVTGEGGNVALYVTSEGVILVDDMFYRNHEDIVAQASAIAPVPIRYLITTHQHDDHAGGVAKMLPIAEVIAHRNVRANLIDLKQPYYEDTPGTPIGLPRITFTRDLSVHLGGREVRVHHFGRGHTSGDAIVHFPDLGVIHTGDLFLNVPGRRAGVAEGRPPRMPIYVDSAQGGSLAEWAQVLDQTLALDFDTVIPGHGPLATRADLVQFKEDVETMHARLADLVARGTSRAEIVRILETDYGWRAAGCPERPPTPGCLQYQQVDALIAELRP